MKISLSRLPLGILTALVTIVLLIISVFIIYAGVDYMEPRLEAKMLQRMPPEAAQAYTDFNAGKLPSQESLQKLLSTMPELEEWANWEVDKIILGFGMTAVTFCGLVGYWLARKISRPLEVLAQATQDLRAGDFAVRVGSIRKGAKEVATLVKTFDELAAELENMENRLRFNTMAVAHELRTPLTILQGNLQGMADGVFPLEQERVRQLLLQVEGLSALVEDLRTLSLAAGQKLVTQRQSVDLAAEAAQVLGASRTLLGSVGMSVELSLQPAQVSGDSQRLRQALLALIENATRYAADGGVLRCETGRRGADEAFIRLLDRGPGLPDDVSTHSIDLFWRGDASRSRATGGTGLGLSVVQAIAKAHGGRLEFASRAGGGAVITIVLPRDSAV
ncbi:MULTISPECIES: ATP-binding protein [unclassified Ensifer]|uniref:ATP-binding protein n=1 Tax=unclassified Ensifer TaxID=2633371 RepID=UPI0008134264|nr:MULTISPECIES: ATP-binding protein [unclassified Ensifer]OCP04262.1 two-component sensor histidine kinase [Ensifer sp. LC11]OCP04521.1 two-component sensor histidine kinase [Ensifer sp. LC13]OCP08928.1 two-component sensor histidine kinase [Ensifer sp. LC14]OCP30457.1 two-component sensor histidine kinase [Ensifer sp. LC499]